MNNTPELVTHQHLLPLLSALLVTIFLLSPLLYAQPLEEPRLRDAAEPDLEWGSHYDKNTDKDSVEANDEKENDEEGHSLGHIVLLYLPNRIFDILDVVRARVKVGPGIGAGLRVTDVGELYVGGHTSLFAGLPGPRQEASVPIPVGIESRGGVKVSVLDGTAGMGFDPNYSISEVGASVHLGLVGADLMVDPVEVADLLGGFFLIDIQDDDL